MSEGLTSPGDTGQNLHSVEGTMPGSAKGDLKSGGATFAGNGKMDIGPGSTDTSQHDKLKKDVPAGGGLTSPTSDKKLG